MAPPGHLDRMGYRGYPAHPVHQEGLVLLDRWEKWDCLGILAYQEQLERRALREVLVCPVPQEKGAGLGYLDLWGLLDLEGPQDHPDHPTALASVTWKSPMGSMVFKE